MDANAVYGTLTAATLEEALHTSGDRPLLVAFGAPWCGTCRAMEPVLRALGEAFAGRARIAKLDVDTYPDVADRYQVLALLFFAGGELVGRATGYVSRPVLARHLEASIQRSALAAPGVTASQAQRP